MYEGGIRVPMIAWSPGLIKPGTVSGVPGYFADIIPTFAAIANSKTKFTTDGTSIYPIFKGETTVSKSRFLYWEFFENGFEQAVRYGKWKAVRYAGKTELYDLEKDAGEEKDLSANNPDIVKEVDQYLKTARTESPFWPVK